MGCTLGVLSFCLSLYIRRHRHTHKRLLKAGHTSVCKCILEMCTHRRSSTDVKDLLFSIELPIMALYSYTPHTHTHTHTHTPRFQQFCSLKSGPTLVKVKPGEFPASAPMATCLAFRFWDTGSGLPAGPGYLLPAFPLYPAALAGPGWPSQPLCLAATVLA